MIGQATARFRGRLEDLAKLRGFLGDCLEKTCHDARHSDLTDALILATHEAASNVIVHAYKGCRQRPFEVRFAAEKGEITISIVHRGKPLDRKSVESPSFDGSRDHGFGVFLIERLVDSATYVQEGDGTSRVTLRRRVEADHQPSGGCDR